MNDEQLNRLFKAARAVISDTERAELGFETRLLARVRLERVPFIPWAVIAWRLMPAFVVIVVAVGVWAIAAPGAGPTDLRSVIVGDQEERTLVTYFTGD